MAGFFKEIGKSINKAFGNVSEAPFVKEMGKICSNMYRQGWDERNGGNISVLLDNAEVENYLDTNEVIREIPMGFDATSLIGKIFIVTGTGKYFKNVEENPEVNLGIIKIKDDGVTAQLLWGYADGGKFTSELPAHLMTHIERLKVNPNHRVVMHTHPTNILAMTFVHDLNEIEFTKSIWRTCTECMVVFPDGIGVLPWMLCGTNEIGVATAQKMKDFRIVVWAMHGIYGVGNDIDEAFGLIETVEKGADLHLRTAHLPRVNTITDENLKLIAKGFNVKYKDGWLD